MTAPSRTRWDRARASVGITQLALRQIQDDGAEGRADLDAQYAVPVRA